MDMEILRRDFPFYREGPKSPIYFDNACQSLRPRPVLEAMTRYYYDLSACGGRSMHRLGEEVNRLVETARSEVARFINAPRKEEIIFTRNTTEGINLVARSLPLREGDVVVLSDKEHNSNLLPWQQLARRKGIVLRIARFAPDNTFDLPAFERLAAGAKLIALGFTSNLDGVTIPAAEIIRAARRAGALVLLDAAQTAPRQALDVHSLDVDFLAFSGHKLMGPAGTGVLYGKYGLLEALEPFLAGGGTVATSTLDTADYLPPPEKFEAGLLNYAGIIGLGEAVKYLRRVGFERVREQELLLNRLISDGLREIPGLTIIGPADPALRGGIVSFYLAGADSHRIALMLDQMGGIMVRSGQHCVHSWFGARGIEGSVRASVYFYNTAAEAETFVAAVKKITRVL